MGSIRDDLDLKAKIQKIKADAEALMTEPAKAILDISIKPSKQEIKAQLWTLGEIDWKLDDNQKEIYRLFKNCPARKFVLNCSRRMGKSYLLCIIAIEFAYKHPNAQIKFAAPTAKMVRNIIRPAFRQILEDCPKTQRPKENKVEGQWEFPNGSVVTIAGCDDGNAESLRGQGANLCLIDEAGFVNELNYVVESILTPQMLTTDGRMILASTPPRSPGHPFRKFRDDAIENKALVERTIYDNPRITPKIIKEFLIEAGGEKSTTWKREYLAQFVTDEETAVLPEFTSEKANELVKKNNRPAYCDKYVSIDIGFTDGTGILYAYWDFQRQVLVIEDESFLKKAGTKPIAEEILAKEKALWEEEPPYLRISDVDPRLQADMVQDHGIFLMPTEKQNKDGAIAVVRLMIANNQIEIDPKCLNTIRQMREAVWRKTHGEKGEILKSFERTPECGHYDLVDALIYLVRNIHKNHNPTPPPSFRKSTQFRLPGKRSLSEDTQNLINIFVDKRK